MNRVLFLVLLLAAVAMGTPLFNIGTGTPGVPWSISVGPDTTAPVVSYYGLPWVPNPGGTVAGVVNDPTNGRWITPGASVNTVNAAGTYLYQLCLVCLLGPTYASNSYPGMTLAFQIAADDSYLISITGSAVSNVVISAPSNAGPAYTALHTVTATLNYNGAVANPSALLNIQVTNAGTFNNPTGLLVTGTLDGNPIPEPATWVMLGLGTAAIAAFRLRRKS